MADRTSAALFAEFFEFLADNPDERSKKAARYFYEKTREYDFSNDQMNCDDALVALGLARKSGKRIEYMWDDFEPEVSP